MLDYLVVDHKPLSKEIIHPNYENPYRDLIILLILSNSYTIPNIFYYKIPVIVGFVWNFSHKLTIIIQVATAPTDVKQNHINLKKIIISLLNNVTSDSLSINIVCQFKY